MLKGVVGHGWVQCLGRGWVVVEVGWVRCLKQWLMVGLKQWIFWSVGGSVGLIIGSSDGGFGDDFFLMGLLRWVSNRLGFKSVAWVSNRWLGWWVWWPLFALTSLMVCVCVALLMVWWFVFVCVALLMDWWFVFVCVCVALCVWWWVWIGWSVYHGYVCVELVLEVEGEREVGKSRKTKSEKKVMVGKK